MTVNNGKTFGSPGEIKSTQQYLFAFESPVPVPSPPTSPPSPPILMAFQAVWLHSPPHKPGLDITESNDFKTAIDVLLASVVPAVNPFPSQEQGSAAAEHALLLTALR